MSNNYSNHNAFNSPVSKVSLNHTTDKRDGLGSSDASDGGTNTYGTTALPNDLDFAD
jgi:hypothetical protein